MLGKHRDESQGHLIRVLKTHNTVPDGHRGGTAQQHFRWAEGHVLNHRNVIEVKGLMNSKEFGVAGSNEKQ